MNTSAQKKKRDERFKRIEAEITPLIKKIKNRISAYKTKNYIKKTGIKYGIEYHNNRHLFNPHLRL